jgi:uncharacterized protein (TIGR00255 family)
VQRLGSRAAAREDEVAMKSMTGYGAAQARLGDVQISVEIRSVNHRNLDLKVSVPREYARWEAELRRAVSGAIDRGRVEVYVSRAAASAARSVALQKDVAAAYVRAWRELKREFSLAGEVDLSLLQGRTELFQPRGDVVDAEAEVECAKRLIAKALMAHARERAREGKHLARDMHERVRALGAVARGLQARTRDIAPKMRERLHARMTELLGKEGVDPARLAQEAALLAERSDVTEELVRLQAHLASLAELLADRAPVGKRIDFLLQEVHRELNTVGSKSNDLEATRLVLDGKAEVEKLREQVQNVE